MNERLSIEQKVRQLIADSFEVSVDTLKGASSLESVGVDKIGFYELLMVCEEAFNIELQEEEVFAAKTIDDVVNLVSIQLKIV